MQAPDFSLLDQHGAKRTLTNYKGKWVVIYFYPKDDTPGCTKEACGFRDIAKEFSDKNVVILGISKDTIRSHKKFAEKYHLSFPLLSDPTKEVISAYNAWGKKKFMGREFEGILRKTVLIDSRGYIKKEYANVDPLIHAQEVLADIKIFSK